MVIAAYADNFFRVSPWGDGSVAFATDVFVMTFHAGQNSLSNAFCVCNIPYFWQARSSACGCRFSICRQGLLRLHHRAFRESIGWAITPSSWRQESCTDDFHGTAAVRACVCRSRFETIRGGGQVDLEQQVHQLDESLAVGVQKAEVARATKASWQDVAKHQP